MSVSCEMCALEGKPSKFIFPALVPLLSTRRQLGKVAMSGEHISFCALYSSSVKPLWQEVDTLICWNNGSSHSWKKTVLTSSFNRMVPPPHSHDSVQGHLNDRLPQSWISCAAARDQDLMHWPPHLTPCDFIKDHVFVPPFPVTLVDLHTHITVIDHNMLQTVWQ
jgi:hypothetical protein